MYPNFHNLSTASALRKTLESVNRIPMAQDERFYIRNRNPYLRPLRVILAVWFCVISWVFIPSYSGTLVAFFSLPFFAKPLNSLDELYGAMKEQGYSLGTNSYNQLGLHCTDRLLFQMR